MIEQMAASPSRVRSPYTAMDGNSLALQVWSHGKRLHFVGSRQGNVLRPATFAKLNGNGRFDCEKRGLSSRSLDPRRGATK